MASQKVEESNKRDQDSRRVGVGSESDSDGCKALWEGAAFEPEGLRPASCQLTLPFRDTVYLGFKKKFSKERR